MAVNRPGHKGRGSFRHDDVKSRRTVQALLGLTQATSHVAVPQRAALELECARRQPCQADAHMLHKLGFSQVSARPQHPAHNAHVVDELKRLVSQDAGKVSHSCVLSWNTAPPLRVHNARASVGKKTFSLHRPHFHKNCTIFRIFLAESAANEPTLCRRNARRSSWLFSKIFRIDWLLSPPIRILTMTSGI